MKNENEKYIINENIDSTDVSFKWYVLSVITTKESSALRNLMSDINLYKIDDNIAEIILPYENFYSLKNGKKVMSERLTFPGYIFIKTNLAGETVKVLKNTKNVISFTGDKSRTPIAVRKSEIEKILAGVPKPGDVVEDISIPYLIGEEVMIHDGPFATFKGKVTNVDDNKKKVIVTVSIFGRANEVALDYVQVDKI